MVETPCSQDGDGEPQPMFEADKGTKLSHPNIVQTYKSHTSINQARAPCCRPLSKERSMASL